MRGPISISSGKSTKVIIFQLEVFVEIYVEAEYLETACSTDNIGMLKKSAKNSPTFLPCEEPSDEAVMTRDWARFVFISNSLRSLIPLIWTEGGTGAKPVSFTRKN